MQKSQPHKTPGAPLRDEAQMHSDPPNIIFFGTPEFGKIILERLVRSPYKPSLVVTAPDKPVGREQEMSPPPVKLLAQEHKIVVIQPESLQSFPTPLNQESKIKNQDQDHDHDIDIIIVAAYGKLLPKKILEIPKYGTLNVHPSLLPRWRGSSPIQYAILNGDTKTGVTVMLADEELDHGPILAQKEFGVSISKISTPELSQALAELGAKLLTETIPKWVEGEIKPKEQVEENATYSRILTKQDGHIDWSKTAEEIERQIRAFTPWPGSFTFWREKRIRILGGFVLYLSAGKPLAPGQTFLYQEWHFAVQTGMGLFVIERLQLAGKEEMTMKEFLNGYAEIIGTMLA